MPQEKVSQRDDQESVRHAEWVREHPRIDESAFPEYPDEAARRGSSRGAVPNGNPWRPVEPDEKPGRVEAGPLETQVSSWDYADGSLDDTQPGCPVPEANPLGEPTYEPAIVSASTDADERIGRDIGDVLATSKSLEGTHLLVEVEDGEVYLRGTVADRAVRGEVARLCSSVRSAKQIHNDLDVRSEG